MEIIRSGNSRRNKQLNNVFLKDFLKIIVLLIQMSCGIDKAPAPSVQNTFWTDPNHIQPYGKDKVREENQWEKNM